MCGALMLSGCAGLGAQRMSIDRDDYTQRLRESEKSQLLSNIVAMHYGDAPLFLGVTSVISQYTRESGAGVGLTLSPPENSDHGGVSGSIVLRETPTVTYTPMSGERFVHSLLSPIPPASLLAMMEAGWESDRLFRITVRSINGVRNISRSTLFTQAADPRFREDVAALRRLQMNGVISLRIQHQDKGYTAAATLEPNMSVADKADLERLKTDLRLTFDGGGVRIVFSSLGAAPGEIAIATRSMLEVLAELGEGVEDEKGNTPADALIRIHSGDTAPARSHVAVNYRGRWFWIDADDEESKRIFLLTQVLLSLSDQTSGANAPLVTIPAG